MLRAFEGATASPVALNWARGSGHDWKPLFSVIKTKVKWKSEKLIDHIVISHGSLRKEGKGFPPGIVREGQENFQIM